MKRRELMALIGGATAAWPLPARAQQKAMPVIGFLSSSGPASPYTVAFLAAFRQGLSEAGYVEGQNLAIEYRWAEEHMDRLPALAADLVERTVDVIFTTGGLAPAQAAKNATATIPIVFGVGIDPVARGLVASLARPGGNLTGFTVFGGKLGAKRLDLLTDLVPQARAIGYLLNPANPSTPSSDEIMRADVKEVTRAKGVQLHLLKAGNETEIDAAFATLAELQAGGLLVGVDPLFYTRREQLMALAARHRVPTIYWMREFPDAGGLISYGPSGKIARPAGVYVGRILAGEKPADLPVQQPTKFELVINLKTAKALGLTVPPLLEAQADDVIE